MVVGPKYYTINGIWALKPYYLGPWTLREFKVLRFIGFRGLEFFKGLGFKI